MNLNIKKIFLISVTSILMIAGSLVLLAYANTWGKTEIEFRIHINEELVLQSVYGEPPTFAIWMEDPETGAAQTIFVTSRAGLGDWEGKADVPAALPLWFEMGRNGRLTHQTAQDMVDAVSGATPRPGYFMTRVNVKPGSKWVCWIEMNLSGDFNEYHKEYDEVKKTIDEYGSGQPALVYKAIVEAVEGNTVVPEVIGMSVLDKDGEILQPLKGITTALDVFDEMSITVVRPKPRIVKAGK